MKTSIPNQPVTAKLKRDAVRKQIPSILDPFTEKLLQMDKEAKSIHEIADWLKAQGIETADSNVAKFLARRRQREQISEQLDGEKNAIESFLEWRAENPNAPAEAL